MRGNNPKTLAGLDAAPRPSDADLLRRLTAGDRQAIAILYERHWQHLVDHIVRKHKEVGRHRAEDVASETLLGLWPNRRRLASVRSFTAYIRGIAKNLIFDGFTEQVPAESELSSDMVSSIPTPDAAMEQDESAREVTWAMGLLAESRRSALEKSLSGLSARQIAALDNSTKKAVQRLIEKAKDQLDRLLSRCGSACVKDTPRREKCPALKENLFCRKYNAKR